MSHAVRIGPHRKTNLDKHVSLPNFSASPSLTRWATKCRVTEFTPFPLGCTSSEPASLRNASLPSSSGRSSNDGSIGLAPAAVGEYRIQAVRSETLFAHSSKVVLNVPRQLVELPVRVLLRSAALGVVPEAWKVGDPESRDRQTLQGTTPSGWQPACTNDILMLAKDSDLTASC